MLLELTENGTDIHSSYVLMSTISASRTIASDSLTDESITRSRMKRISLLPRPRFCYYPYRTTYDFHRTLECSEMREHDLYMVHELLVIFNSTTSADGKGFNATKNFEICNISEFRELIL